MHYMNIFFFFFNYSILMFLFYYKNILLTLISMEFMMINLFMFIYTQNYMINLNLFFMSTFITLSISEGVIGLSIMVYMMRLIGNDYSNMLNLMKW